MSLEMHFPGASAMTAPLEPLEQPIIFRPSQIQNFPLKKLCVCVCVFSDLKALAKRIFHLFYFTFFKTTKTLKLLTG